MLDLSTVNKAARKMCDDVCCKIKNELPESLITGLFGGAIAASGMALRIGMFASNPVSAGLFCATTHFLRKAVVIPSFNKILDQVKNSNTEVKYYGALLTSVAISSFAIAALTPVLATPAGTGTLIYFAAILTQALVCKK